jgi:hypothetical protein
MCVCVCVCVCVCNEFNSCLSSDKYECVVFLSVLVRILYPVSHVVCVYVYVCMYMCVCICVYVYVCMSIGTVPCRMCTVLKS